ncbi:LysR family transcriptional regulator [Vibrio sp. D420a]|uniref:LysR family transcriptional regulator n=1 Tax=Vibrio sp. D420a TaxID=2836895 RepID=UPI002554251E|nr:LysR family transcriptional regulator [Vibrio sp. D420a]MDK9764718.1 LysR family transcriptional regulator [Vibrio sp. D420a]
MDWFQCVKSYIQVVDQGSFNGAARKQHTTSSAVSKRVSWLEERLGVQLLKRTTRSVIQTEAGVLFYQRSKVQLDEWQSVIDETRSVNQTPSGVLRIGASLAVGAKFLVQYFGDFLRLYPDIKVLLLTTTPGQVPELNLDLFISPEIEHLNSFNYKAMPLFEHKLAFYASPDYLHEYGEPKQPEELTNHNMLIHGESPHREIRIFPNIRVSLTANFATTNVEALFYAAKGGMGILMSNDMVLKEELKNSQLKRILPHTTLEKATMYAYYPNLDYQHTRTKLFLDFLKERLREDQHKGS